MNKIWETTKDSRVHVHPQSQRASWARERTQFDGPEAPPAQVEASRLPAATSVTVVISGDPTGVARAIEAAGRHAKVVEVENG